MYVNLKEIHLGRQSQQLISGTFSRSDKLKSSYIILFLSVEMEAPPMDNTLSPFFSNFFFFFFSVIVMIQKLKAEMLVLEVFILGM